MLTLTSDDGKRQLSIMSDLDDLKDGNAGNQEADQLEAAPSVDGESSVTAAAPANPRKRKKSSRASVSPLALTSSTHSYSIHIHKLMLTIIPAVTSAMSTINLATMQNLAVVTVRGITSHVSTCGPRRSEDQPRATEALFTL